MTSRFAAWNQRQPRLGSDEATELDLKLLGGSIKPETRRKYEYALNEFKELDLDLPLTQQKVLRYLRCLVEVSSLNAQSIRKRVTALKTLHSLHGYLTLDTPSLEAIKRALQSVDKLRPAPPPKRATVVPNEVLRFFMTARIGLCGNDELARDALLMGTSLSLRAGELLSIRSADISSVATNQTGIRVKVDLGVTKCNRVEEVEATCTLTESECSAGGLWCTAHKLLYFKASKPPPLKIFGKLKSFSRAVKKLNRYLPTEMRDTDLPNLLSFTGHSCRRTGAQCQVQAAIPKEVIKTAARWKQDGMVNIYTEERLKDEAAKSASRIREVVCASGAN